MEDKSIREPFNDDLRDLDKCIVSQELIWICKMMRMQKNEKYDDDRPNSYPILGLVQLTLPFPVSRQNPSTPKVATPFWLSKSTFACIYVSKGVKKSRNDVLALRKYTDLNQGTENDTTASRIVAMRVTRKPGVAGLKIMVRKEEDGRKKRVMRSYL